MGVNHIAFIMDGNGRWAQAQGKPREYGHKVGVEVYKKISTYCKNINIKVLTVYALSTENLKKRPKHEVAALMQLIKIYLDEAERDCDINEAYFRFPGDKSGLPDSVVKKMARVESITKKYEDRHIRNICINYGGRDDIVRAANAAIASGKKTLTEDDITENLTSFGKVPPDLIVRTGGEVRISNFLRWDSAYSEFIFSDILWPDMKNEDVDRFLEEFAKRNRRFGAV